MKKISVIVICFNAEDTLQEALSSVCNQSYRNLEIIVVDDASVDRSPDIAESFAREDERVQIIRHRENRGILAARSSGVEAASGDWIMHLDSDDMLMPHACETALKAIECRQDDFVQFGTIVSTEGNISRKEILRKEKNLYAGEMCIDCRKDQSDYPILRACYTEHKFSYTQWNKIYSAAFLKNVYRHLETEQINMGEDMYALFVAASMAKSMSVIKDKLYIYHFGYGISCVNRRDPLQAFEKSCLTMKSVQLVQRYVCRLHEEEKMNPYVQNLRKAMLDRTLSRFYPLLSWKDRIWAIKILGQWWTARELIYKLVVINHLNYKPVVTYNLKSELSKPGLEHAIFSDASS